MIQCSHRGLRQGACARIRTAMCRPPRPTGCERSDTCPSVLDT
ncbi:hypothetical protein BSLA_01r0200 [Burkholderia stabilis]|nr:hypothetical protein BSLA_01r0200 [Burkholderia stabilis]